MRRPSASEGACPNSTFIAGTGATNTTRMPAVARPVINRINSMWGGERGPTSSANGAAVWVNLTVSAGRPSLCEHEYKIDRLLFAHKHHAQIHPRGDQANFVTDPFGDQRSLGVVDGDALFAVIPALVLVDFRPDGVVA